MNKIHFASKEENNRRREREFLMLSPSERVVKFLKLCDSLSQFQSSRQKKSNGNFEIVRTR